MSSLSEPNRESPHADASSIGTESVATYPEDDDPGMERPADLAMGETVADRYTVLSSLGRGGYASVYLARDKTTGTNVALKVLRVDRLSPVALKRMSREADTARAFQHDRLVRVLDFGRFGDNAFLAMEPVLGQTLRDRMRAGVLPIDETIRIAEDVLQGLSALHQQGIVHRDVKPSNILLDHEGRAKLADFGLVTAWADDQSRATQSHAIVGTLEYVSPEQALGEALDGRSDLYSLGVVLYEMLSGAPLHGARSSLGALVAHLTKPTPDVRASRESIPDWLAALTSRLLEKDRGARHPTAEAALSDLRARSAPPRLRAGRRFAVVTAVASLTLLASLAWRGLAGGSAAPALGSVEVKSGILRGLDSKGNVLWTHSFGAPLDDSQYTSQALQIAPRLRLADLDGDGRDEVLIGAPTEVNGLHHLFALESDGTVRFERVPGRRLTFGDGEAYEGFGAFAVHFYIDQRGRRRLFLLSVHRPEFPSILEELNAQGRLLSEYTASGNQTALSRVRFRGQDALAIGGYHNETRGASVTFLGLDEPRGRAPSQDPRFLCVSCPQHDPLAIVLLPRSDVVVASAGEKACPTIGPLLTLDDGILDVTVRHGTFAEINGAPQPVSVGYALAPDVSRVMEVRIPQILETLHNRLFAEKRLDHRFGRRDADDVRGVRTWDGKRWVMVPSLQGTGS